VLVGACPLGLTVFPKGTSQTEAAKALSAFLHVCPGEDWLDGWSFPALKFSIEVKNIVSSRSKALSDTHDFSKQSFDRGWNEAVKCNGYQELKQSGWVFPDNTVRFTVAVSGASLSGQPKVRPKMPDTLPQIWKKRKFTDMVICTEDADAELQCHRACLATVSPVFDRMLASRMQEGVEQRIVLRNASSNAARFLMEYVYRVYTDSLPEAALSDFQVVRELMQLADQYDIKGLLSLCAKSVVESMAPTNFSDAIKLLGAYSGHPMVSTYLQQLKLAAKKDDATFERMWQGFLQGGK